MLLRNLPILVVGVVMILVLALPALAAKPAPCDHNYPNCGTSTDHRNNASGQGNFGQCHKRSFFSDEKAIEGSASSQYNPSSVSPSEADCREVVDRSGGGSVISTGTPHHCPEGMVPTAESRITFDPDGLFVRQDCVPE